MDPIPLLMELVAADSVNPSLVAGGAGEREAAAVMNRALRAAGLDVTIRDVAPGRPNVVGVLDGRSPGPTVMFCGHLDTVGVEGMTDPFTPRVEHGRRTGAGRRT
jgi:acetylornithine deacetylase